MMFATSISAAFFFAMPAVAGVEPAERVTAVSIETSDAEALRIRPLIGIKPHDPLNPAAIRHAVELIFASGAYEDVIVRMDKTPRGVMLVFRPIPVRRLARIVVEGDAHYSVGRVHRITGLRHGNPLRSDILRGAAHGIEQALHAEGFHGASVEARARALEDATEVVFTIKTGPPTIISACHVTGVPVDVAALISRDLPFRGGERYERKRAQHASEAMEQHLRAAGYWRARVVLRENAIASRGQLELRYEAESGQRVLLRFIGADLKSSLRREIVRYLRDGKLTTDVMDEMAERIQDDLQQRGFPDATADFQEEQQDGLVVTYRITPGSMVRNASVRLDGAPHGFAASPTARVGDPYIEERLENDAREIENALEAHGYPQAKVRLETTVQGNSAAVIFRISAGSRADVGAVSIAGIDDVEIPPSAKMTLGAPFRVRDVARARDALLAILRNQGYLRAEVEPKVSFSSDQTRADVAFVVHPGVHTSVEHIVIAGLVDTREAVVRRELLIHEGEALNAGAVSESQKRLSALGLFRRVSIRELSGEPRVSESLIVAVEEGSRTQLTYGLGAAGIGAESSAVLRASAEVTRRNVGGLDRSLSLFSRLSFNGSRFMVRFSEPYLLNRRALLAATAFREEEERDTFSFDRLGASVEINHALAGNWSLVSRYTFSRTRLTEVGTSLADIDRQYQDATFSGPSVSMLYDTRDDALDPRRGFYFGADVQFSHRSLGGNSFVKSFLQASIYRKLTPRLVLATSTRLGLADTFFGEHLAPPDRFFAGGDYSLRGFATDAVHDEGGRSVALSGLELRLFMNRALSVAVFGDLGNVYPTVGDMTLSDLRYTAGVGLRYRTAFGPLRLDWGYKLNRRSGESPGRIHVTIGHAF